MPNRYASEEWSFQVGIVMAALVGSDAAAAHAVALNIHLFTNTCFGRSFGETALTLVGNMLGAGDWIGARRVGVGIVWLSFFATAICSVLMLLLDTTAALVWSTDGVVLLEYSMIVPMVALVLTVDNCACVMQGVLAACGYQQWGAACYLLGCTCLGVPLGWYLTFQAELGLVGLWYVPATSVVFSWLPASWYPFTQTYYIRDFFSVLFFSIFHFIY